MPQVRRAIEAGPQQPPPRWRVAWARLWLHIASWLMTRALAYYVKSVPDVTAQPEPEGPWASVRRPDRLTPLDHALLTRLLRHPDEVSLVGSHPEWWRQRN